MINQPIYEEVLKELKRAKKKFPGWPEHPAAQAGIVCEEAGELMKACLQFKYERKKCELHEHKRRMREEAVQVIVTAIRFIENL